MARGWPIRKNRANALYQQGEYAQALAELQQAIRDAPDEAGLHVSLGSTLTRLGDLAAAERAFARALELDPSSALAAFNLGALAARTGDERRAIAHYETALAIDPGRLATRFNLANSLFRSGRFEAAADAYGAVVAIDPRNAQAWRGQLLALVQQRAWRRAAERLETALATLPEDSMLRNARVRLLAAAPDPALRDGARAVALAQELAAAESSLPNVVALAMALAESGRFDLAAEQQARAIEAVEAAGRLDLLPPMRETLARYRRDQPCRDPWSAAELSSAVGTSHPSQS